MRMHNPPHPGEVLRELCLQPQKLSVTDAARALGVSRKTLWSILNGRDGITAEMALRLAITFDTTPESWLNQQLQYNLSQARGGRRKLRVARRAAGSGKRRQTRASIDESQNDRACWRSPSAVVRI